MVRRLKVRGGYMVCKKAHLLTVVREIGACTTKSESSDSNSAGDTSTAGGETTATGVSTTEPSTTEPTTTEPTSGTIGELTDSPFVMDPDHGFVPPECTTYADTCPEGQKWIMPYASDGGPVWTTFRCVELLGDGEHGQDCTNFGDHLDGIDDCGRGHFCFSVDPQNELGHCHEFCSGTPSEPSCNRPYTYCPLVADGLFTVCLQGCDPLLQDCFDPGDTCYADFGVTACYVTSASDGSVSHGQPCDNLLACELGLACISNVYWPGCQASDCCAPHCNLDNPSCPPETECVALGSQFQPWLDHVDLCLQT